MKIENRFLKYISFDTQSDPYSDAIPSTFKQTIFADFLVEEMKILGIENARKDEYGIVYGTIPSNNNHQGDVIGFIAHMDTSSECSGKNVNPNIIRNYDGSRLTINQDSNIYLDPEEFECLNEVIGHDIITTDGSTLLGADDKAGISIIMTMIEYLYKHPEFLHNDIQIAFTPDEEIGRGADHFNVSYFNADYAYTLDGSSINDLSFENFNAYKAVITIKGKSIHPGRAKNKMKNASMLAIEFDSMLPKQKRPEFTEKYEGFHHLVHMEGSVEKAILEYIVRDHDFSKLKDQLNDFKRIQAYMNSFYGEELINVEIIEQYLNMKDVIVQTPEIIEQVEIAMKQLGIQPSITAQRGGTDGSRLSYMGLPCPNIGTGGFNFHGPYEFVSINMMKKGVELLLRIIHNNLNKNEDLPF